MSGVNSSRNVELDIMKGGLVFIMLFYHCVSVSPFSALRVITDRIHFIHSAFLVITGFLCGYHYYPAASIMPGRVQCRLLARALKIFVLFLSANIAFHLLGYGREGWDHLSALPGARAVILEFLVRVPGDFVAFEILYLIALFLVIAAILIHVHFVKWLLGAIILLPVIVPGSHMLFIAFGCAGMFVGILAQEGRLGFMSLVIRKFLWLFPLILIVNLVFIPHPRVWPFGNEGRLFFSLAQTLIWLFSFLWCVERPSNPWVKKQAILLGRYSLLAYLFQMICARIVYLLLSRMGLQNFTYYGVCLILVTLSTWLAIIAIDQMRKYWRLGDRAYRIVFQ